MKYIVSLLGVLVIVTAIAGSAGAVVDQWQIDFDGTKTLTQLGFVSNGQADSTDLSVATGDGDTIKILDNTSSYRSKMRYDLSGLSSSVGIVMARIKGYAGNGNTNGTFGITMGWLASPGKGVDICVRDGNLNVKGGNGDGGITPPAADTNNWHVYAIKYDVNGWTAYQSSTSEWSSSSADWWGFATGTFGEALSNGGTPDIRLSGIQLGNNSGAGTNGTWDVDYIQYTTRDLTPWAYNPVVPEPSSVLALASGLIGMAGFAIRRRRA